MMELFTNMEYKKSQLRLLLFMKTLDKFQIKLAMQTSQMIQICPFWLTQMNHLLEKLTKNMKSKAKEKIKKTKIAKSLSKIKMKSENYQEKKAQRSCCLILKTQREVKSY